MNSSAQFDAYAETYDQALHRALASVGEDKQYFVAGRVEWLKSKLHTLEVIPRSVLDYGCGTGSHSSSLLSIRGVGTLTGVDVSSRSVEAARRAHDSPRCHFFTVSEYVPSADIDVAYTNGVFHHILPDDRLAAADYVFRSLRIGGLFAFWENNPWNPGTRYVMSKCEFDEDAIPLTPCAARRLLRTAGFEVLSTEYLFIFPRQLRWFRPLEPWLAGLPFGGQYLLLARKPGARV
jgi:SAM-dependent methyltransferase